MFNSPETESRWTFYEFLQTVQLVLIKSKNVNCFRKATSISSLLKRLKI